MRQGTTAIAALVVGACAAGCGTLIGIDEWEPASGGAGGGSTSSGPATATATTAASGTGGGTGDMLGYTFDPPTNVDGKSTSYPDDTHDENPSKISHGQLDDGVIGPGDVSSTAEQVGWYAVDPTVTFDLGVPSDVSNIKLGLYADPGFGIYLPKIVVASTSVDGSTWTSCNTGVAPAYMNPGRYDVTVPALKCSGRYVRVALVRNPANGWTFVDEITPLVAQ